MPPEERLQALRWRMKDVVDFPLDGAAIVLGDPRTVDKLFDHVNDTWDDTHMWLVPFQPGKVGAHYSESTHIHTNKIMIKTHSLRYR